MTRGDACGQSGDQADLQVPDPDARVDGHLGVDGDSSTTSEGRDGLVVDAGDLSLAVDALDALGARGRPFPPQNIHCIYTEGSGCYGQNKADDVALDAAVISQVVGKPIRVAYMRVGRARLGELRPGVHDRSITAAVGHLERRSQG